MANRRSCPRSAGRLMHGRTVIAIAHRLSTVRRFDRILVLERGRLVQDGSPDALMRGDGTYRRLIEAEMQPPGRANRAPPERSPLPARAPRNRLCPPDGPGGTSTIPVFLPDHVRAPGRPPCSLNSKEPQMRIAQIAPLMESIPPRTLRRDGEDRLVSHRGAGRPGHDVTLFASGESITPAKLVPCAPSRCGSIRPSATSSPTTW